MSMDLGVVIIVGSARETPTLTPDDIFRFAQKLPNTTAVFLVGIEYRSLSASDAALANITIVPDFPSRVFAHPYIPSAYTDRQAYDAPAQLSGYTEMMAPYRSSADQLVTYICFDPYLVRDVFELAAFVCTATLGDKRKWLAGQDAVSFTTTLGAVGTPVPQSLPNVFTADAAAATTASSSYKALSASNKLAYKELMIQGMDILRVFLRANFHIRKNSIVVPGWAIQTNSVWMSLIIGMFDIRPGAKDLTHRDEVLESSAMRQLLCFATLNVLSNYLYFGFPEGTFITAERVNASRGEASPHEITEITKFIHDEREILGWVNPNLWDDIRSQYAAA